MEIHQQYLTRVSKQSIVQVLFLVWSLFHAGTFITMLLCIDPKMNAFATTLTMGEWSTWPLLDVIDVMFRNLHGAR